MSGTRTFFFFAPGFQAEIVGVLIWAETILYRIAMPNATITMAAPPMPAPMIVPTEVAGGGAAAAPAARAST